MYSIESTLNTIAAEKNKKILYDIENIVTCTKSFEMNPLVMTNIYELSSNCRDTALATISAGTLIFMFLKLYFILSKMQLPRKTDFFSF